MCVYKNIHENIIKTSGDKSRVHVNLKIILTSWKWNFYLHHGGFNKTSNRRKRNRTALRKKHPTFLCLLLFIFEDERTTGWGTNKAGRNKKKRMTITMIKMIMMMITVMMMMMITRVIRKMKKEWRKVKKEKKIEKETEIRKI